MASFALTPAYRPGQLPLEFLSVLVALVEVTSLTFHKLCQASHVVGLKKQKQRDTQNTRQMKQHKRPILQKKGTQLNMVRILEKNPHIGFTKRAMTECYTLRVCVCVLMCAHT